MKAIARAAVLIVGTICLTEPSAQAQCENRLTAPDGAAADWFGRAVALTQDTVVTGSPQDDDLGADSGTAYVFVRNGSGWDLQAKLLASDGAAGDIFGRTVSIHGDTLVVGAAGDDDLGSNSGAVYVFSRTGERWIEQAKFVASDGGTNDHFGICVSIFQDTILIGAYRDSGNGTESGSAYIFVRDGTTWVQQARLIASDGTGQDWFGRSVSLWGDTALVGALWADPLGQRSGEAYVFQRQGTSWSEQATIVAPDGDANDQFGFWVSVFEDTALIGARWDEELGDQSGSAYVFERTGSTWSHQAKLLAADGEAGDQFGVSVSLYGDKALVGAVLDTDGSRASCGSAYVFERQGSTWSQSRKLVGAAFDWLGYHVAMHEDQVVAGATAEPVNGNGSAYVFDLACLQGFHSYGMCARAPCGNTDPTAGCANSTGPGALLSTTSSSTNSIQFDDLVLTTSQAPLFVDGFMFMGSAQSAPLLFGDGVRNLGGQSWHFPLRNSGATGTFTYGPGLTELSVTGFLSHLTAFGSPGGSLLVPGTTWYFQTWYRDPGGPCASGYNLSNALRVSFAP